MILRTQCRAAVKREGLSCILLLSIVALTTEQFRASSVLTYIDTKFVYYSVRKKVSES